MSDKIPWQGTVLSVQPRIRLTRSYDQRFHNYLGYVLQVDGDVGGDKRTFSVGVGKAAHAKHQIQSGCEVKGLCETVADSRMEPAEFYKVTRIEVLDRGSAADDAPPPWLGIPPDLPVYRERGHRRLDARTYGAKCTTCIWGCLMPVEMIIDQWKPDKKKYRSEAFCYGPLMCHSYKPGPNRKVPGRRGMVWEEPDWVDDDATSHRGPDD